jgi:hypothetical protein
VRTGLVKAALASASAGAVVFSHSLPLSCSRESVRRTRRGPAEMGFTTTSPCQDSRISSMLKGSAKKNTRMQENKTVLRLSWCADIFRGVNIRSVLALSILRGLLCVLALSSERRDSAACESLAPFEAAPRLSLIDQDFVCSWIERTFDVYKCMRDADSVRPPPRGENALFSSSARQLPSSPCTRY